MRRLALLTVALFMAVAGVASAAQLLPNTHTVTDANGIVTEVALPFTVDTILADSTTTTVPATTTTTTIVPPVSAGQCVLDQIVRDRTKRNGTPKLAFNILLNNLDVGEALWKAPYQTELGSRDNVKHGWISGDRGGYKGAYMFLVEWTEDTNGTPDWARVLGRVTFARAANDATYVQINDSYMDEIQTTGIKFDGTCGGTSQAEQPNLSAGYAPSDAPDFRPIILYVDADGNQLEDRSYTNTVMHELGKFAEHERITDAFLQADGVGGSHVVWERVTVLAYYDGLPVVAVYYDSLEPGTSLLGSLPENT